MNEAITSIELADLFNVSHRRMMKEVKECFNACCDGAPISDECTDGQGKTKRFLIVSAEDVATLFAYLFSKDGKSYWLGHDALSKIVATYMTNSRKQEVEA